MIVGCYAYTSFFKFFKEFSPSASHWWVESVMVLELVLSLNSPRLLLILIMSLQYCRSQLMQTPYSDDFPPPSSKTGVETLDPCILSLPPHFQAVIFLFIIVLIMVSFYVKAVYLFGLSNYPPTTPQKKEKGTKPNIQTETKEDQFATLGFSRLPTAMHGITLGSS